MNTFIIIVLAVVFLIGVGIFIFSDKANRGANIAIFIIVIMFIAMFGVVIYTLTDKTGYTNYVEYNDTYETDENETYEPNVFTEDSTYKADDYEDYAIVEYERPGIGIDIAVIILSLLIIVLAIFMENPFIALIGAAVLLFAIIDILIKTGLIIILFNIIRVLLIIIAVIGVVVGIIATILGA